MSSAQGGYYLPQPSGWPLVGSIGLFLTTAGFAWALPADASGSIGSLTIMYVGLAVIVFMLFGWFRTVIKESESGSYNDQVDRSFRMSMGWFIFSEVMFFAAFFGALFYIRVFADSWLGGTSSNEVMNLTKHWLYPEYTSHWPTAGPGESALQFKSATDLGGAHISEKQFTNMGAWGVPAVNTALLMASSVTVTIAHHALRAGNRAGLNLWLAITIVLGFVFLGGQVYEYYAAYSHYNLKLTTGAYGSTFFMLTGFHGLHVTIGATMLLVIWFRSLKGHFKPENHFAFEAAAWYWHFVDVVWLGLFIFVYWLV